MGGDLKTEAGRSADEFRRNYFAFDAVKVTQSGGSGGYELALYNYECTNEVESEVE